MKPRFLLPALIVVVIGAALGLFLFNRGDETADQTSVASRPGDPAVEDRQAPAADLAAAERGEDTDDDGQPSLAPKLDEGRTSVEAGADADRFGAWDSNEELVVRGRVEFTGQAMDSERLVVMALPREFTPRELYGTRGAFTSDPATRSSASDDDSDEKKSDQAISRAVVAPDGTFEIPFPPDTSSGWLAVAGGYLYSKNCVPVDPRSGEAVVLEPALGARVSGHVKVPTAMQGRPGIFTDLDVELGPDPGQFSMLDLDAAWMFDREPKVDPSGFFDILAVDPGRPYAIQVESDYLSTFTLESLEVHAGRTLELEIDMAVGATVKGFVTDEGGSPVAGTKVSAKQMVMWGFPGGDLTSTRTADDGSYTLENVPAGNATLIAEKDGFLSSSPENLKLTTEQVQEDVNLVLEVGNTIAGRVRWPDGTPAAGVEVDVDFDPEALMGMTAMNAARGADGGAETDEEGRFLVKGMGKGPFLVRAEASRGEDDGKESFQARSSGVNPNTEDLILDLAPLPRIWGQVTDAEGTPVEIFRVMANAKGAVFWAPGRAEERTFTDEEGRFELVGLDPVGWEVQVRAEGFGPSQPQEVELPLAEDFQGLVFVMRPASSVSGIVLSPSGDPLMGAVVGPLAESSKTFAQLTGRLELPEAYSDESGHFMLEELGDGALSLVAKHPDYAPSKPAPVEIVPGNTTADVVLQLREGGLLTGEVYGKDGEPTAGAQIIIQDMSTFETVMRRTQPDGTFEVQNMRPGNWQVTAMVGAADPGGAADEDSGELSSFMENLRFTAAEVKDGEETHVVLGAPPANPVHVVGKVTHAGEPVAQAAVSFFPEGAVGFGALRMRTTDENGAFELDVDEPGMFLVQVQVYGSDGGFQQQNIEFNEKIVEGDEHEVNLSLPTARISGRVLGPDRKPVSGVRVTLTTSDGVSTGTFMGGQYAEVTTREGGLYDFNYLRPGTFSVAAGGSMMGGAFGGQGSHGRVIVPGLRVSAGSHVEGVDFRLQEPGDITGTVLDALGQPLEGASVFVRDAQGNLLERFSMNTSGPGGKFEYPSVAPGEYTVVARSTEGVTVEEVSVTVRSGEDANATLRMGEGTVLKIVVIDRSGKDVRAKVSVKDSKGREMNGMVSYAEIMQATEGFSTTEQRLGPVPPDKYTVTVVAEDGRKTTKSVTLTGQAERKLKIRLK